MIQGKYCGRKQIYVQHMLVLFQFSKTFYFPLVVNFKNTTQQKKRTNKKKLEAKHQEKGNKFYN